MSSSPLLPSLLLHTVILLLGHDILSRLLPFIANIAYAAEQARSPAESDLSFICRKIYSIAKNQPPPLLPVSRMCLSLYMYASVAVVMAACFLDGMEEDVLGSLVSLVVVCTVGFGVFAVGSLVGFYAEGNVGGLMKGKGKGPGTPVVAGAFPS